MRSSNAGSPRKNPELLWRIHYSTAIFLGSFLLFFLEPLYAKMILPWFGGASSVWAVCLVFFQGALLLGYGYAHVMSRNWSPRFQCLAHVGLLLSCFWLMPITPDPFWRPLPGEDPTWRILGLLVTQIGLPFVLLSATSPLVQVWYSRALPGRVPYRLFALSNAASFLALLCFPFLVEPSFSTGAIVRGWSWLFVLYAALVVWAAWRDLGNLLAAREDPEKIAHEIPKGGAISFQEWFLWIGLSACGSILLLSMTNHLLRDVASVPLLWVLPLSLYLLSFVLVFSKEGLYSSRWVSILLAVTLVFLNYAFYDSAFLDSLWLKILVSCAGLFLCCFFCHGELAKRKPVSARLTSYYLMIALGGALGSVAVGLVAPKVFASLHEYPLSLMMTALVALGLGWSQSQFRRVVWGIILLFLVLVFAFNLRALRAESLVMVRNFYAALRVVQEKTPGGAKYLSLCHGVVVHGKQFLDPKDRGKGTSYYGPASGAALAIKFGRGPKKIGVIGLGVGTLSVYGNKGDLFRFYEIDPQVVRLAESYFSFLRDSPAKIELVPGDARLSLDSEKPNGFDVLAVDAFSGDAIPVHLLTKEAFQLYERHLKPGGILAFHTSNLNLDLALVVRSLATEEGYPSFIVRNQKDPERLIDTTEWVLVSRNADFMRELKVQVPGAEVPSTGICRVWTDDYSSLFSVIRE